MTQWKCPNCGGLVLKMDDNDERLACMNSNCNFNLELYEVTPRMKDGE
jgi:ribosomal protein S27AE